MLILTNKYQSVMSFQDNLVSVQSRAIGIARDNVTLEPLAIEHQTSSFRNKSDIEMR